MATTEPRVRHALRGLAAFGGLGTLTALVGGGCLAVAWFVVLVPFMPLTGGHVGEEDRQLMLDSRDELLIIAVSGVVARIVAGLLIAAVVRLQARRLRGQRAAEVQQLAELAALDDEEAALRRYPPQTGPPLRCASVAAVMAGATVSLGGGRNLLIPWSGGHTSVESLAGSLLAAAAMECQAMGWLHIDTSRRKVRLTATLPPDRQPSGIAQIVLGRHRVGYRQRPWVAQGLWKEFIRAWLISGDIDPHWKVVELSLGDLRAAGILAADEDGQERVDAALLRVSADAAPVDLADPRFARNARQAHRGLKAIRITDADGSMIIFTVRTFRERRERRNHGLPKARAVKCRPMRTVI